MAIDDIDAGRVAHFGGFTVLSLYGTWRGMGRQYGALASRQIKETYKAAIEDKLLQPGGKGKDAADAVAKGFYANYPHRLRELLSGMSETSGLDFSQHLLLNAVEVEVADEIWGGRMTQAGCTGIAVWGEYSSGPLVYGRNYDYFPWFRELGRNLLVTVYHPCDGSLAVATIGYPGCAYMTTGINERGIFLALNNGEPSGGALQYHNRVPAIAELFMFLLDSPDLDQLESFFQSTRSNFAYVIGTADDQTSRCFEWPVFDVKRRLSVKRPGLMVATNHFTEPSWGLPRPDDAKFSWTRSRRQNLLNLAEHFKGSIDVARMKKILDTRLKDLGATTDNTVYQIIAIPGSMSLSLKVPDLTDWTDIPAGDFLRGSGN
ncbi:MAG: C45 family autoproteolytic acyltransferase/hydrolase [Synergistaceae bacterium]|nr:C45 family autoproteolytic acyltransferase/hydrolase [Synergistaceae bacterium]